MGYEIGYDEDGVIDDITRPPIQQGSTFILDFTVTIADGVDSFFSNSGAGLVLRGQYRPTPKSETAFDFVGEVVSV